jgi:hypothetical protein
MQDKKMLARHQNNNDIIKGISDIKAECGFTRDTSTKMGSGASKAEDEIQIRDRTRRLSTWVNKSEKPPADGPLQFIT